MFGVTALAKFEDTWPLVWYTWGRSLYTVTDKAGPPPRIVRPGGPRLVKKRKVKHPDRLELHWKSPKYTGRIPLSPFSHHDYGIFFAKCDAYYTKNIEWFRSEWRLKLKRRCLSPYDAWMKEALFHFYRCCDRSKYPPDRPGWNVASLERHDKFSDPLLPPPDWCGFPSTLQNQGLHHAHVEARRVYYFGPMPPHEEPPPPNVYIHLGYESRLIADAFFSYNPNPKYFEAVMHTEAEMGFAVLEAYDTNAPLGEMAGSDVHSIRPFFDGACLHQFRPSHYRVFFMPPQRSTSQRVSQNSPDWDLEVDVYWLTTKRPWNSHPQIIHKKRGWFADNTQPWGPNIQYGDYWHSGYHLPHEYCFYGEI